MAQRIGKNIHSRNPLLQVNVLKLNNDAVSLIDTDKDVVIPYYRSMFLNETITINKGTLINIDES